MSGELKMAVAENTPRVNCDCTSTQEVTDHLEQAVREKEVLDLQEGNLALQKERDQMLKYIASLSEQELTWKKINEQAKRIEDEHLRSCEEPHSPGVPSFGGSGSSSEAWRAPVRNEELPRFGRGSSSEVFETDKADAPVVDLKAAAERAKRQEAALAALGTVSQALGAGSEMLPSPTEVDSTPTTTSRLKEVVSVAGLPRDADGSDSEDSLAISSDHDTIGTDLDTIATDGEACRGSPESAYRQPLPQNSDNGTVIYSPRQSSPRLTTGGSTGSSEDGQIIAALRERCVHLENEGFALREEVLKLREALKASEQASDQSAAAPPEEEPQVQPQASDRSAVAPPEEEPQEQPQAASVQQQQHHPQPTQIDWHSVSESARSRGPSHSPCRAGRAQSPSGCRGRQFRQLSQSPPPLLPRVDMADVALHKVEAPPNTERWIDSPAPPTTPPSPAVSMKLQNFFFEVPDSTVQMYTPTELDGTCSSITSSTMSPGHTPRSCSHAGSMKVLSLSSQGSAEAVFRFAPAELLQSEAGSEGEIPCESQLLIDVATFENSSNSVEVNTPKTDIVSTPKTEIVESDSDDDPDVALLGPMLPFPLEAEQGQDAGLLLKVTEATCEPEVEVPTPELTPDARQRTALSCPSGHLLTRTPPAQEGAKSFSWVCDGCEKRSDPSSDSTRWRCNYCDYDLCGCCSHGGTDVQHSSAFMCPLGHQVQAYAGNAFGQSQWTCQGCSKNEGWTSETLRYKCDSCNYSVCNTCRMQKRSGQVAAPATLVSKCGPARNPGCMPRASQPLPQAVRQSVSAAALIQRKAPVSKANPSLSLGFKMSPKPAQHRGNMVEILSRSSPSRGNNSQVSPPQVSLATHLPIPARISTGCLTLTSECCSETESASPIPRSSRSSSPARLRMLSGPAQGSGQQKVVVSVTTPTASLPSTSPSTPTPSAPPNTARITVEPNPNEPPISMPATFETFEWLGNLALPLISKGTAGAVELGRAFRLSDEANSVHIHLHGCPSGEATYNKACCFSIAADAFFEASDSGNPVTEDVSPGLPPAWSGARPQDVAEARLELAITTLDQSVAAGFSDTDQMLSDPDLRTVRERRAAPFAAVIQRAQARKLPSMMPKPFICQRSGGASPSVSCTSTVPSRQTSVETSPHGPKVSPICTPGSVPRQSLGSCTVASPTPVRNLASLATELPTSALPGECL